MTMGNLRPVYQQSVDKPPKPYWIIEETVTPAGHTIRWPGSYGSEESAQAEIDREIQGE